MKATEPSLGVIYDVQALQNPLHRDRGIGRYIIDHVDALLALDVPLRALALNPQHDPALLPDDWHRRGLVRWNTPELLREVQARADRVVYHVASPFEPTVPESGLAVRHALRHADVLSVAVFDTIPYLFPEIHQRTADQRSRFRLRAQLLRRADIVLTISDSTRRDVIRAFGLEPTQVITQGTGGSPYFCATPNRRPETVQGPYVFAVSGWGDPRKDPLTTFRAFAEFKQQRALDHKLVVACNLPPEGLASWRTELEALGLEEHSVVLTGHISDEELRSLYTHADLFIMSSRYEGFGLPVLEAARCGAPAVTTNASSLPEVLSFPPSTFDPGDTEALAQLIHRSLTDTAFRTTLLHASAAAAATHVWSRVGATSISAWTETASNVTPRTRNTTQAHGRATPINIAFVGPFPPSKSGIGTFNARVGAALASRCTIDFFTEGDNPMPPLSPRDHGWFPVQALGRTVHVGAYDTTIYTIGNSHYHRATLAAALSDPGIVWLHDAALAGLYLTSEGLFLPSGEATPATLERARTAMRSKVAQLYGPTPVLNDDDWWRSETYDRQGVTMLRELLASARAIIVNTEAAAEIARREAPADLDINVLALPFPPAALAPNPRNHEPLTIATLGWVDHLKQPADLIRAFALVRSQTTQRLELVFIGELAPALEVELKDLAAQLNLDASISFTGFTSDDDYATWLQRVDIVVQLRRTTRGEASAALCDAIAYGIPTITSITTANEFPNGIVRVIEATSDPQAIAKEILELVEHPTQRINMSTAARLHARGWGFDALADRVIEFARLHQRGAVATR